MWQRARPDPSARDERERFVIASHHPDRLRRPAVSVGLTRDERFHQALVWNIFRTLELVSPSFWLRRLQVRLTGEPAGVPPQTVRVHLWQHLSLPPVQRIDGERAPIVVDVVIETEHAAWTLMVDTCRSDFIDTDLPAAVVDAGIWFAGIREHYCGLIASADGNPTFGSVLQTRYSRSRDSARLRSATRGPAAPSQAEWGAIQWTALATLLQDCCDAASLPPVERLVAKNALDWLIRVGVQPEDERSFPEVRGSIT